MKIKKGRDLSLGGQKRLTLVNTVLGIYAAKVGPWELNNKKVELKLPYYMERSIQFYVLDDSMNQSPAIMAMSIIFKYFTINIK